MNQKRNDQITVVELFLSAALLFAMFRLEGLLLLVLPTWMPGWTVTITLLLGYILLIVGIHHWIYKQISKKTPEKTERLDE